MSVTEEHKTQRAPNVPRLQFIRSSIDIWKPKGAPDETLIRTVTHVFHPQSPEGISILDQQLLVLLESWFTAVDGCWLWMKYFSLWWPNRPQGRDQRLDMSSKGNTDLLTVLLSVHFVHALKGNGKYKRTVNSSPVETDVINKISY